LHALLHPAVSAHAEPALRRSMSQLRRSAHGHLPLGARIAVVWAFHELGRPYVYGAAGPNAFDCSGLARFVWGKAGRSLAHYTGAQVHEGHRIGRRSARPGDLVFFGSDVHHVGVYVGDGYMIDAPHSGANVHRARVSWGSVVAIVRP
jgi:cell wall-associated NlpC family hydrolase